MTRLRKSNRSLSNSSKKLNEILNNPRKKWQQLKNHLNRLQNLFYQSKCQNPSKKKALKIWLLMKELMKNYYSLMMKLKINLSRKMTIETLRYHSWHKVKWVKQRWQISLKKKRLQCSRANLFSALSIWAQDFPKCALFTNEIEPN